MAPINPSPSSRHRSQKTISLATAPLRLFSQPRAHPATTNQSSTQNRRKGGRGWPGGGGHDCGGNGFVEGVTSGVASVRGDFSSDGRHAAVDFGLRACGAGGNDGCGGGGGMVGWEVVYFVWFDGDGMGRHRACLFELSATRLLKREILSDFGCDWVVDMGACDWT